MNILTWETFIFECWCHSQTWTRRWKSVSFLELNEIMICILSSTLDNKQSNVSVFLRNTADDNDCVCRKTLISLWWTWCWRCWKVQSGLWALIDGPPLQIHSKTHAARRAHTQNLHWNWSRDVRHADAVQWTPNKRLTWSMLLETIRHHTETHTSLKVMHTGTIRIKKRRKKGKRNICQRHSLSSPLTVDLKVKMVLTVYSQGYNRIKSNIICVN